MLVLVMLALGVMSKCKGCRVLVEYSLDILLFWMIQNDISSKEYRNKYIIWVQNQIQI